jgi:hypothetical protein
MQSQPSSIIEWMNTLGPGERLPVLIVGSILSIFAIVFIVTVLAGTAYKMHKNRLADALKRDLLERGMNAEEIVMVITAKPNTHVNPICRKPIS